MLRLRGICFKCFSLPPSLANLLALSLAMRASNPSFTKAVFSFMPVILDAWSIKLSSIFNVVLMLSPHYIICLNVAL